VLTAAEDGTIARRDGSTGRVLHMYRLGGDALTVAADPQTTLIAAGGRTSVVRIWRRDTDAVIANVDVGKGWVHSLAFRPDGKTLAIAVDHSQGDFQFATGPGIGLIRFVDPRGGDDRTPPSGLSTTRLWDMPSGGQLGAELVGGRVPYTVRTVDLDEFAPSRPAFSPDGRRLVTAGADGAATLWDLEPRAWVRAACSVAGRDLTAAEWREHLPGRHPAALCGD
jgi:WD40 repeat protein